MVASFKKTIGTECPMERELGTECPMEQDQVDHDAAHGSMPEDSTNEQIEPRKEVNLYVGMEFESLGDAFKCYSNYAHNKGFSVRRNRITKSRSNKSIIGQEFVCSKEGFRSEKILKLICHGIKQDKDAKHWCMYPKRKRVSGLLLDLF